MKVGDTLHIGIKRKADNEYIYDIIKGGESIKSGTSTATITIANVMQKVCQEVVG